MSRFSTKGAERGDGDTEANGVQREIEEKGREEGWRGTDEIRKQKEGACRGALCLCLFSYFEKRESLARVASSPKTTRRVTSSIENRNLINR